MTEGGRNLGSGARALADADEDPVPGEPKSHYLVELQLDATYDCALYLPRDVTGRDAFRIKAVLSALVAAPDEQPPAGTRPARSVAQTPATPSVELPIPLGSSRYAGLKLPFDLAFGKKIKFKRG